MLKAQHPAHPVELTVASAVEAQADPTLVRVVLESLLSNSWKFTSKTKQPRIEFGCTASPEGLEYYVRDNGVGFDRPRASKLFVPFNRFHGANEFPGSGIGLATAHRVVARHGGRMRAESAPNQGAAFYFTLQYAVPHETVTLRTRDGECPTHVLTPPGAGPWPAAIFYVDAGGIRPAMVEMAQRLADAGYVCSCCRSVLSLGPYGPLVPKEVFAGDFRAIVGPMMASDRQS